MASNPKAIWLNLRRPPFEVGPADERGPSGSRTLLRRPADDKRWLRIIFDEAGLDPAFTIRRTYADVLTSQLAAKRGWDSSSYEAAKSEADHISPRTHRAEADARYWAVLSRMISKGTAARRRTD
jgi:hypothetical protein